MAAYLFVAFMNSETVQEMLLMSGDVSPTAGSSVTRTQNVSQRQAMERTN